MLGIIKNAVPIAMLSSFLMLSGYELLDTPYDSPLKMKEIIIKDSQNIQTIDLVKSKIDKFKNK